MSDPRYPVGKFIRPEAYTTEFRNACLLGLEQAPAKLELAVAGLTEAQLDTPYRDGGWTVRQVVHHVADSHMQSYLRCKFAVSEDNFTVKPYDEAAWAQFEDATHLPVEVSLSLLRGLHRRWVAWFRSLPEQAFSRTMFHPENGDMSLDLVGALYSWHCRHHTAHIEELRKQKGW